MTTAPLVTAAHLRAVSPACSPTMAAALAAAFSAHMPRCGITTPRRIRHFIAQLAHECAGFRALTENLNYSAERLCIVWPSRFPTLASAAPYARNPRPLANKVYGGRMGNVGPDDGWKHRGRSPIMGTGRDFYSKAQDWTGLPLLEQPDLAAEPAIGAQLACDWWRVHGLNALADADAGERVYSTARESALRNEIDDVLQIRRRINGGTNGLEDTKAWLTRTCVVWPG
jgi:putative chitinase